jgi:hypothetical protein
MNDNVTISKNQPTYIDPFEVDTLPLHLGYKAEPLRDPYFEQLVRDVYDDKVTCQEVLVGVGLIRPYCDYEPPLNMELAQQAEMFLIGTRHDKTPVQLLLYERDGQVIMSSNYELYAAYKVHKPMTFQAIMVGPWHEQTHLIEMCPPFKPANIWHPIQSLNDRVVDNITRLLKQHKMEHGDLDRRLGRRIGSSLDALSWSKRFTLDELEQIALALQVEPAELLHAVEPVANTSNLL